MITDGAERSTLSASHGNVLSNEASQNDSFESEDALTVKRTWNPRFPAGQRRQCTGRTVFAWRCRGV